jgi:Kef-type K+ transport system membrane component KefB
MTDFMFLVVTAAVGLGAARWLGLPAIPLLLVSGFVLGSAGAVPDRELLESMLLLGLAILAFVVGLEMNPARVGGLRAAAVGVGLAQFLTVAALGLAAGLALGYPLRSAAYLALAVTASSTLVGVRLLRDRKELSEPHGRMTVGVLLLQDVLVMLLIPVAALAPAGVVPALGGLGRGLLLVAAAYLAMRVVTPLLVLRLRLDDERLLVAVLAVLFLFLGAGAMLGLPLIAGGFLAGVSMSSFPARGVLRGQLDPVADFFSAVFFAGLGALVGVPTPAQLLHALLFAALVVLTTPVLVATVAGAFGVRRRPALESGLLLAQTSEFSLVVGIVGLGAGHLEPGTFTVIVLVTVLTMTATPFLATDLVTWRLLRFRRPHPAGPDGAGRGHVVVLGAGENGSVIAGALRDAGRPLVVVDDDPASAERLRESGIPVVVGDASRRETLERAGVARASAVVSTLRRATDLGPVYEIAAGRVPVLVRVFSDEEAEDVRSAGATPVLYAEAAAEHFLRWYEETGSRLRPGDGS